MQHSEHSIHVMYFALWMHSLRPSPRVYGDFTLPYTRDSYKWTCNYIRPVGGDKQYVQYWNQNQSFTQQKLPLLFVVAQLFRLAYFEERKLMITRVMQELWR